MARLADLNTLVTGAGAGIGRAIASRFALEGARVAVVDRKERNAAATAEAIRNDGGSAFALACDVSDESSVARMIEAVSAEFQFLHALVNNAAIAPRLKFVRMREDQWDHVWQTNLQGAIRCTQGLLPLMQPVGNAKIVNIASIMVSQHARRMTPYAASKGALASLSRGLAVDLAPFGIRVNYICPGFIHTDMTAKYASHWLFSRYLKYRTPLRRLGRPDDVAKAAVFLASPDADFITGEGITVDGGMSITFL